MKKNHHHHLETYLDVAYSDEACPIWMYPIWMKPVWDVSNRLHPFSCEKEKGNIN
jgi:hypothetical protein